MKSPTKENIKQIATTKNYTTMFILEVMMMNLYPL